MAGSAWRQAEPRRCPFSRRAVGIGGPPSARSAIHAWAGQIPLRRMTAATTAAQRPRFRPGFGPSGFDGKRMATCTNEPIARQGRGSTAKGPWPDATRVPETTTQKKGIVVRIHPEGNTARFRLSMRQRGAEEKEDSTHRWDVAVALRQHSVDASREAGKQHHQCPAQRFAGGRRQQQQRACCDRNQRRREACDARVAHARPSQERPASQGAQIATPHNAARPDSMRRSPSFDSLFGGASHRNRWVSPPFGPRVVPIPSSRANSLESCRRG